MAEVGKVSRLRVVKVKDFGVYLDAGRLGEVLLPKRVVPEGCQSGDELEVMVYLDSEDRLVASTAKPLAQVGEFACLKVVATGPVGAFLDWGLPKDLLVPFSEQKQPLREGRSVIVYVYLDNSNRIAATTKLDRYLDKTPANYQALQQVELLIAERTDLGTKAIINNRHWGLLFKDDQFKPLRYGQRTVGYIKQVRADGKIDLHQNQPGSGELDELSSRIINHLQAHQGFSKLNDKGAAEEIARLYGVSKRKYKMAIGGLYKRHLIAIEDNGIRLLNKP